MFGHKRIPSREGGIEVVVEELATRIVEQGHKVTCYNRKGHHVSGFQYDTADNIEHNSILGDSYKGVKLKKVWTINKRGLAAITSSLLATWMVTCGNYDIVHIHAEGPATMCWLPKLAHKKVIVTVHGLDWQRAKWGSFATKYIKWGERQVVKYADEIIVLSKGVQNYFKKTYGRKTVFIPNGVTRPKIKEADRIKKLWNLDKDSYILFLGRIVPEKGLQYLVEAWKSINTEKKLVIVGGSSDTEVFLHKLKEMAGENVIFTGFQQGKIFDELYSNAYIYCLPSDLEGMPLSLLEAMSYGNCCLVSDILECMEVVEEKAIIFKKSNIDDLRKSLQELIDKPEKVQMYRAGVADYITKKYNWDDVVEKTLKLYRK